MIAFSKDDFYLVCGASSGIGYETAMLLNRLGASVIASGRNTEKLMQLKAECDCPDRLWLEPYNLTANIAELPAWITQLRQKFGKLKGLVCSSGIARVLPLQGIDLEDMRTLFDIDYFAPIFLAKGFADRRNHTGNGAAMLFIASISAFRSDKGHLEYAGAKAALAASIKSIGRELTTAGIRVNCLSPSNIRTPLTLAAGEAYLQEQANLYPLGIGAPDDVAGLAVFLLSEQAKWITCQNYIVDCGSM